MMGWVDTVPMPAVRLIGGVEILGVAGLILPPLTGVAPGLASTTDPDHRTTKEPT